MEKKNRILIVDDIAENIAVLAGLLKDEYMIVVAKSGETAMEMARRAKPDIVLLDIVMPGMDGYEVIRRLKESDETRNLPVICITSLSEALDEAKAFRLGAVDFITKPFNPLIVKARVETHLNLKMKTDMLEELVSLDGLTGISNRRRFDEALSQEWKRASRNGSPLSLVFIDIDYFKRYNDHYGHAKGDECLKRVANGLKSALPRSGDFLARYGGEEFVVVLPDTDLKGAEKVAERLLKKIESLNMPHERSLVSDRVTISVGVSSALARHGMHSPDDLIQSADRMLYKSKGDGRNRFYSQIVPSEGIG